MSLSSVRATVWRPFEPSRSTCAVTLPKEAAAPAARTAIPAGRASRRPGSAGAQLARGLRICLLAALLPVLPAAAQPGYSPVTSVQKVAGGKVEGFFVFQLEDGSGFLLDRLNRQRTSARIRGLATNLFAAIGRPEDQAARPGEILFAPIFRGDSARAALLVETSSGYLAYIDPLGSQPTLGDTLPAMGRPFGPIASTSDSSYVFLPRRGRGGRSEGIYLYHAAAGRALYLHRLGEMSTEPVVSAAEGLPPLPGPVSAIDLLDRGSTTRGYLVVDQGTGAVHRLTFRSPAQQAQVDPNAPGGLRAPALRDRKLSIELFSVFDRDGERPAPRRFHLAPIFGQRGETVHVLVLDAANGDIALIQSVGTSSPSLRKASRSLGSFLPGDGARVLTSFPEASGNGATIGLWVLDSLSRTLLYLSPPVPVESLQVVRVALNR